MLTLDIWFFLLAAPAVMFAGVSKGGFGSGASFASASILALIVDPGVALGVMLPLLMLIDVASLRPYWGQWNKPVAILLISGGVPGIALGAWLFTVVEADVFRVLIGGISLGFVVWQISQRRGSVPTAKTEKPRWVGVVAGAVAGFTSFVSHAGGPAAAIYMLSMRFGKTEYQATSVIVFWILNFVKFIPYAFLGMFTWQTASANLLLAPFALIGTWAGVKLHQRIPEKLFFGMTYVLLCVTGSKLIWDGLT
ncbi:MAG: sulfite exporter TauE/SafE family protein [Aliishimia sp.]